jgi:hypothetical protein
MAKPRSKLRRVLAIVIGVPVVLVALYLLTFAAFFIVGPFAEDYSQRIAFHDKAWRERSLDRADAEWPTRLRMVDDLIAKRRLDGLTRNELLVLLGPADKTDKWRDWDLVYWLGHERSGFIRIDSEWLVIRFDDSGRVGSYQVVAD